MHINNMKGQFIAIIGMPRSGSTIISSFINSIDDSFIVSEPHSALARARPKMFFQTPTIAESRYGPVALRPGVDVIAQVESYATRFNTPLRGFKECWAPWLDVVSITKENWQRIDRAIVTIRDPRKNYASMASARNQSIHKDTFCDEYTRLAHFSRANLSQIHTECVVLDEFLADPLGTISNALGQEVEGRMVFRKFTGGGDVNAMFAKNLKDRDNRQPYTGRGIERAIKVYEKIIDP